MYRYIHFHIYIYMYIHSKYSFNAQILSSLEVDPVSLLGDAMVIFQADLHTVHLGEFFLKKVGNQTGTPLFFCWTHQEKNLVQMCFCYYKRGEHPTQEFKKKNKNHFLLEEMGVVIIPKVEGTFPFSMGDALVSPWKRRFFSKG